MKIQKRPIKKRPRPSSPAAIIDWALQYAPIADSAYAKGKTKLDQLLDLEKRIETLQQGLRFFIDCNRNHQIGADNIGRTMKTQKERARCEGLSNMYAARRMDLEVILDATLDNESLKAFMKYIGFRPPGDVKEGGSHGKK